MQCPVCLITLPSVDPHVINAHIDECLTNQFLAEQQRPARPRPHEDTGAAFLDEVSLDEQMALELARAATDDTMLGFGMTYRDNTFNCPYPGCASKLEAQELPAHAATKHSACIQTLSCPICEHETGTTYTPNENTNLLQHLGNAHGDLAEMHQALMMSRSMYVEQCIKPVELPKEVGKGSQVQTLRDKVPDQECQICLLDFNKGDRVTWMDCFCVFHEECIETWFKKVSHRECPVHKDD